MDDCLGLDLVIHDTSGRIPSELRNARSLCDMTVIALLDLGCGSIIPARCLQASDGDSSTGVHISLSTDRFIANAHLRR